MQEQIAAGLLSREQPLTADAAKAFSGFVQATFAHKQQCPFCKCPDCKKGYSKRGALNPEEFTLRVNCQGMKK
jgi:hypothetical protein